jgi:hypothetical protein
MCEGDGLSFQEACESLGVAGGKIAVTGGTGVFELFLSIGYDGSTSENLRAHHAGVPTS